MATKELVCTVEEDPYQQDWKGSKPVNQDEFVLTKVVGLTNISKSALDCNPVTGYVAFPASSMLVLLDPKTNDQKFVKSPTGKNISCVSFSEDGRLVVLGESGVKPQISVWSLKDHKEQSKFVVDHSVGVKTIAIHPKYCYIVVIGVQDLNIGVWDYIRCQRLALTKWQTVPLSLTIPKPGTSVILCGHRKITLFNLDKVNSNSYETNVFEDKKAVLLGRQSEYTFIDITSGKGKFDKCVYTVTTCGYLCEIRLGDILIDKATKVDSHAFCVRFALNHVFVGCCEGVVKICSPDTLNVAVAVSLDQLLGSEAFPQATPKPYLDTTAIAVNEKDSIVTCIYSNCSIYSWQINGFSDSIECSVLLPSPDDQIDNFELKTCINDGVCRANMFRSLMGCLDLNKDSRLFDTETLAARNGMRCHHDLMHLIKGNTAKNQHVTSFRFSPDGRDVICGNEAGEIKVYEASTGVLRRVIEAHSAQVMCIELLYDDEYQLVCTGGRDRIIFILNAKADFSLVQVLCDHSAAITAISLVSHDGLLTLVSAAADNLILVRRATPGSNLKFTVTGQIVESRCNKALNVTGDYIITGDKNGNIKLFKADPIFNPKLSKTLKSVPKGNQITSTPRPMCIDPTGSFIATAQNPGQIVVYHLPTGQPIASLPAQTDASAIKFTSCLKYMISSTSNGCTMIWKIPERMTEFLVAKRNKTYQIEVAKEVSYEATFVSCVKVCKEMVRDSSRENAKRDYRGPNNNHNYDTDATPSIESLSFLHVGHSDNMATDGHSICSTESYISCSTCMDSCSDTVHWCPSSDSSMLTNSETISFSFGNGNFGKIVEESHCRKLGPFRVKSEEAVKLNDNADSVAPNVEDGLQECQKCIDQSGATKEHHTQKNTDCINNDLNKDCEKQVPNFKNENAEDLLDAVQRTGRREFVCSELASAELKRKIQPIPTQLKPGPLIRADTAILSGDILNKKDILGQNIDAFPGGHDQLSLSNNPLQRYKQKIAHYTDPEKINTAIYTNTHASTAHGDHGFPPKWLPNGSPRCTKKVYYNTSPTSFGSYRTAFSPNTSMETSCSPGNSVFFSPSPCFSCECEEVSARFRSYSVNPEGDDKESDRRGGDSSQPENYDQRCSLTRFRDSASSAVPNATSVELEELQTTSMSAVLSSNTFTREAGLEESFFRGIHKAIISDRKVVQTQESDKKESAQKTSEYGTLDSEASGTFVKNSKILSEKVGVSYESKEEMSVQRSIFTDLVKQNLQETVTEDMQVILENSMAVHDDFTQAQLSELQEDCATNSECSEKEETYTYHSITRDESGKLRLLASSKRSPPQSPLAQLLAIKSPRVISSSDVASPKERLGTQQQQFQDSVVRNIQCSRCSHRDEGLPLLQLDMKLKSGEDSSREDPNSKCGEKSLHAFTISDDLDSTEGRDSIGEDSRKEFMRDINEQRLQEYFSELRQCLQLTNSQETVYKLACDVQDHELMELLEVVLKKRPSALSETLNIQPDQIELIRRNLVESEKCSQQSFQEMAKDSSKMQHYNKSALPEDDKQLNNRLFLFSNKKGEVCSENEELDKEPGSQCRVSQDSHKDECNQNAAKAIITLVGQILSNRRAAQQYRERVENTDTVSENSADAQSGAAGNKIGSWQKTSLSVTGQQSFDRDCQPLLSHDCLFKQNTLQHTMTGSRVCKQSKGNNQLEVLTERGEENSHESDSMSDALFYKPRPETSMSRNGQLSASSTLDSGIETSINEKISCTRYASSDWKDDNFNKFQAKVQAVSSPEKSSKPQQVVDKQTNVQTAELLSRQRIKSERDFSNLREENRPNKDVSTTISTDRKYPAPIVELFRDQDEYLKKLKEVREKFEKSIQALSNERKSRLAEEERQLNK